MKRVVLLFAILRGLMAGAYAGPEQYSGKDVKETVSPNPVVQWYADNEWNVSVWGTNVFTENGTAGPPEETLFPKANGLQPVKGGNGNAGITGADRFLGADDAWGGGIDLKYFWHRYFGFGIEGYGLAVRRDAVNLNNTVFPGRRGVPFTPRDEDLTVGAGLGTLTLRFPIGRFAPFIFGEGGAITGGGDVEHFHPTRRFGSGENYLEAYHGGNSTAALGQFGAGMEVRITPHIGVTSDFSWNVVDGPNNNFGMIRSGLNFAFWS